MQDPMLLFEGLYHRLPAGEPQTIELRLILNEGGIKGRAFVQTEEDIRSFARKSNQATPWGVYFGVASRKAGAQRGRKEDVYAVPALWADIDVVKMGWDMKLTLGALKQHELRPSAIVDSGYGYHCYWILKEPIILSEKESDRRKEIQLIEDDLKALAQVFRGDNTIDVTRILRLPGTYNTKIPDKPKEVSIVAASWDTYDWRELGQATQNAKTFLDSDGWISKAEMKKRAKAMENIAGAMPTVNRLLAAQGMKPRNFMTEEQVWQHTRYNNLRGPIGVVYMGLDEAILRATAILRVRQPHLTDEEIIEFILKRVRLIKDTQAPKEKWDWEAERKEITDKLRRFNERLSKDLEQRRVNNGRQ